MAALVVKAAILQLRLSPWERLGALRGDLRFPVTAVRAVSVHDDPWQVLRGMRAPGTGLPGVIMLGTKRGPFGKDFCAVYQHRPAVVIDLADQEFERLVVCTEDPEHDAAVIRAQVASLGQQPSS